MKRSRIELLREARAAYRNGEPLGFGTDRIDDARYLFSGGYAVGVSAWNDDGTGYGEIREVTARGDDAVDEWDSRWTRRFADHGARVFYAFLSALFIFLFTMLADFIKARDERRGAAAEDERHEADALPHVLEAPVAPAAALDDRLAETPAHGVLAETLAERGESAGGEAEHAEKQRPQ